MSAAGRWHPPPPPPPPPRQQQHSRSHVTYTEYRLSSFNTRLSHFSDSVLGASVQDTCFLAVTAFHRHGRWAVSIKKKKEINFWIIVTVFTCSGSKCTSQFSWRFVTERVNGQSHLTEHEWGYSEQSQHSKSCRWCFPSTSSWVLRNRHWNRTKCSTECCVRGTVVAEPPELALSAGSPRVLFSISAFSNTLAHCCPVFVSLFRVYSQFHHAVYNESLEASNLKPWFQSWSLWGEKIALWPLKDVDLFQLCLCANLTPANHVAATQCILGCFAGVQTEHHNWGRKETEVTFERGEHGCWLFYGLKGIFPTRGNV